MTPHLTRSHVDGLDVQDLKIRYGGVTAVKDVNLAAPTGRLTGLIGPNGAGKTSILNACSGVVRASGGRVHLFGRDVTRSEIAARARRGLGRTFQRLELCDSMTASENIALGVECGLAGRNPLRQLVSTRVDRRTVAGAVDEALTTCDLVAVAHRPVGLLSTGQRRLVELARVVAGRYRILLLDEPSSGLDHKETEHFGRILRSLVDSGRGILLVEHDMELVMSICDYLYVLDFGTQIFEGTTTETRNSEVVRAAYLGGDVELEMASGSVPGERKEVG